jgi:uncharacterized iron-regulated protein
VWDCLKILLGLMLCCQAAYASERIIDLHTGQDVTPEALAGVLIQQDFVLLGELHDNEMHHQRRGQLIQAMQAYRPTVVAEHMELGKPVHATHELLSGLEQAGFDAKAWAWPLHQSLFEPILQAGIPLMGGNITRDMARKVVREGEQTLPVHLQTLISQAPLIEQAGNRLDGDLIDSHCGMMNTSMLPGLRLAQRARDAAMFDALRSASNRPAVLVAGNGHVRQDYGVPSMIRRWLPEARYLSIGFIEDRQGVAPDIQQYAEQYDYLWMTDATEREDPCAAFANQAPSASAPNT